MPVFYFLPIILAVSCSSAVFLTVLFAVLTRKKRFQTLVPVLGVLQLSFLIVLIIFYLFGYDLQVSVALPHIQQALHEQCTGENIKVIAEGFYIEDVFRWRSDDESVTCAYTGAWICTC